MLKHWGDGIKDWLMMIGAGAVLLAALILPLRCALADGLSPEEEQLWKSYQSGEVIRIHVIANSDLPQDQLIKLRVRDALIADFGNLIMKAGEQSSDAVYQLLLANKDAMEQSAQKCAIQNGFSGPVHAEAGILPLPQKQYGNVTLPAGEYRTLRVTLGDGNGQNWWCVLYPQLCLALSEEKDPTGDSLFFSSERIFQHWLLISK